MIVHYLPTVIFLFLIAWFLLANSRKHIILVYTGTVVSYLNVFPLVNQFFLQDVDSFLFFKYQLIIIIFFEAPLVLSAILCSKGNTKPGFVSSDKIKSPVILHIFLFILVSVFWFVSIRYNLFFRRQGHEGLARISLSVPIVFLYIYRATTEMSFFIINILANQYFQVKKTRQRSSVLVFSLTLYIFTFIPFYLSNSRMHLVLLLLTLLCLQPQLKGMLQRKLLFIGLFVFILCLIIGVTILREVIIEGNDRLDVRSFNAAIMSALELIANRMDPLITLYELDQYLPDIFRLNLDGYLGIFDMYSETAKESALTSSSVLIANSMTWSGSTDFMKTMFLDSYLSFGVVGTIIISLFLGGIVGWVQCQLLDLEIFGGRSLLAMYLFILLLQFEKEFAGFLSSTVKWLPVFFILYLLIVRKKARLLLVFDGRKSKLADNVNVSGGGINLA